MTGSRVTAAVRRRVEMWRLRGDAVECPCCESTFAHLRADRNRPDAICPSCGSHERHRLLWLWLRDASGLAESPHRFLHVAPEYCLEQNVRSIETLDYVTSDYVDPRADLRLDLTAIDLPDASFDALLCSHVMEHVEDERAALAELMRILRPGGWAALLVPVDGTRETTYEDPAIQTPQERLAAYWQHDHVRLYGRDARRRFAAEGFDVDPLQYARVLGPEACARHRLLPDETIFLCRRPG